MKIAFVAFLLFLSPVHKFYVSLTEIKYNAQEKTLEMASKLFIDDLESVVPGLRIKKDDDFETNELVGQYIIGKVSIQINEKSIPLTYLGYEIDDDVIWCYIEGYDVEMPSQVNLQFDMLLDEFDKQTNIVHFDLNKTIKSVFITADERGGILTFE
ncbi:MAG: hypothetical protein ACI81Y_001792 [Glaciecola sp.]|jgi:hypothetical protein